MLHIVFICMSLKQNTLYSKISYIETDPDIFNLVSSGGMLISTVNFLDNCNIELSHYSGTDIFLSILCSLTFNSFVLFGSCLDLRENIFHSMRYISKWCSRNRPNKQIICMDWFNWENDVVLQPPCLVLPPTRKDVESSQCCSQTHQRKVFRPKQRALSFNLTISI